MEQNTILKYLKPKLQIAMADWRTVYILVSEPKKLLAEVHKGKLVYRKHGRSKRYSYSFIKKNLVKKQIVIQDMPLPF